MRFTENPLISRSDECSVITESVQHLYFLLNGRSH